MYFKNRATLDLTSIDGLTHNLFVPKFWKKCEKDTLAWPYSDPDESLALKKMCLHCFKAAENTLLNKNAINIDIAIKTERKGYNIFSDIFCSTFLYIFTRKHIHTKDCTIKDFIASLLKD